MMMKLSARGIRLLEWLSKTKVQDFLAVLILLGVSLTFFAPALTKGMSFGPFDLLSVWPLTHGLSPGLHNSYSGDQIQQFGSWYALDWQLIHHGEFPLWNRYTLLGMPHFTGAESAVLSLPTLVSYLFPINVAYLVIVIVTLFMAGTGTYFFARCLGLAPPIALFAGIAYQLSGPLASWVGMPLAVVNAWIPWLLAFSYLLLVSTRRRRLYMTLLATCVAFTIYAGHPESWFVAGVTGGLFFLSLIVIGLIQRRWTARQLGAFAFWEGAAVILGACFSAPLLLPAAQVIAVANKGPAFYTGLPLDAINGLIAPAYYGVPTTSSISFSPITLNYYETVSYVGSLALILALYALIKERARTEVLAMACTAGLWMLIVFDFGLAQKLINAMPNLNVIAFTRGVVPLGLCIGLLAAYGLRAMLRHQTRYPFDRWLLLLTTGVATFTFTAAIWGKFDDRLTPLERSIRFHSFWGSLVLIAVLGVAAWLRTHSSRRALRLACGLLIAAEWCFLFIGGVDINSYSPQFFPQDAGVSQLIRTVGPNLLGTVNTINSANLSENGFIPNINVGYGVRQFAAYDPILPRGYFDSWTQASGQPGAIGSPVFSPSIENAAVARLYGITYVITPANGQFRLTATAASELPVVASAAPGAAGENQAALQALLTTYVSSPDLQNAFPLVKAKPQNLSSLLAWASQSNPDFHPSLLQPLLSYKRQYQALGAAVARDPTERQAMLSLVEPLPMSGMTLVLSTPDYRLYQVPGAAQFTLAGGDSNAHISGNQVTSVEWLNDYTCRIRVRSASAATLLIRLTNVPGWNAQVNGQPATLHSWRFIMQQLAVPAGESTITLTYWPAAFTHGLDLAGGALAALVLLWAVTLVQAKMRLWRIDQEWIDAAVVPSYGRTAGRTALKVGDEAFHE